MSDTTTKCPRCGNAATSLDHLSRWDDATHICDNCAKGETVYAGFTESDFVGALVSATGLDFKNDETNPYHPWYGVEVWAYPPIPKPEGWTPIDYSTPNADGEEFSNGRVAQLTITQDSEVALGWDDNISQREAISVLTFGLLHNYRTQDEEAKAEGNLDYLSAEERAWVEQGQELLLARMVEHNAEYVAKAADAVAKAADAADGEKAS